MTTLRNLALLSLSAALALSACSGDDDDGEGTDPTEPPKTASEPTSTTPLVTTPNGEPERNGDYEEVASGESDGLAWTLSKAPAAGGGLCWKLETDPELELVRASEHCDVPLPDDQPLAIRVDFPYASDIRDDHDIVVGVVPGGKIESAEFGFSDGATAEPTYIDEDSGVFVWAGPSRPVAAAIDLVADGNRIACGPADITSALELFEAPEAQLLDVRQFPWTCLEVT